MLARLYLQTVIDLFRRDRRAVTAIEYALIAALIAVVIISAVTNLGHGVSNTFGKVAGEL